jgi:hypothetical protein
MAFILIAISFSFVALCLGGGGRSWSTWAIACGSGIAAKIESASSL